MLLRHLCALAVVLGLLGVTPVHAGDTKKLLKDFRKAIAKDEIDGAISVLDEIIAVGGEDALDALYTLGFGELSASPRVYDAVLAGFSKVDGAMAFLSGVYSKEKKKGDFRRRVFLGDAMVACLGSEGEAARAGLIVMLEDKAVHVQSNAVKGLQKSLHREAVEPLIKLLEDLLKKKRKDTLYYDVRDALLNLTGHEFEVIDDWWSWWEPLRESYDPSAKKSGGKTGVERRKKDGDSDFFGVPILSKHVVFMIDNSGSMAYVMRDDIPGLARGDGSDSGQTQAPEERPTAETRRMGEFWSRLGTAKRNLKRVIRKLKPKTMYNCLYYSSTVHVFKKKAVPASGGVNKKAFQWVDGIKYGKETDTMSALERAFQIGAKTTDIYLLSDGIPSLDGHTADPVEPILEKVASMNRYRKIKIHTFGFDDKTYPSKGPMPGLTKANVFLKQLAEATGGKFTLIKVDPRIGPDNPEPPPERKKRGGDED